MQKVKIQIIKIGIQHHDVLFKKLENYNSRLFQISIKQVSRPNCDFGWGFNFNSLTDILQNSFDNDIYDLCIGFIDTEIENNYFSKRLSEKNDIYVVSFFEIDKILSSNNINLFNFMLLTIYRCLTRFKFNRKPSSHHETKGCLFDMCGMKEDIIYSASAPIICQNCQTIILEQHSNKQFLNDLKDELYKIKKGTYYRIKDFIETNPWLSLIISIFISITINILSNYFYENIKKLYNF